VLPAPTVAPTTTVSPTTTVAPTTTAPPTVTAPPTSQFVSRRGADLALAGRRFRYVSYNAFSLTGCGLSDEIPTDAQTDAFFAGLRPNSLVRTWMFMNMSLTRLDRVVQLAANHGQRLIPVLTDELGSCGDPEGPKPNSWYSSDFRARYLPWVSTIVQRYRDNPTIGMWELINEPGHPDNNVLRAFFDEAGGTIHRIDPNHLVESGTFPPWAYGGEQGWRFIHESPGIDVTSMHEYDMNPGASPHLAGAVAQADAIGKPLILGEVGVFASTNGDPSQSQSGHPCVSFPQRTDILRAKFDATFATTIDGVNVWNWMPRNKQSCRLETYPDDPLVAMIRSYELPGLGG
jgi:hypothetical protein